MSDNTITDLDQAEEELVTYEVPDEEVEAAAGRLVGPTSSIKGFSCCFGC